MDPPPPSQIQVVPKTNLFSNPDGTPLRVFTQADLFGRAKVIKGLRSNGAELSSDANNAQIMLVDPPTRQGRQFIRDWGQDSNKIVLNFVWVKRCLEAQRPLLEEDKWGDSLAKDDGHPFDAGEEPDDIVQEDRLPKSPLPTPRVTPEELARMRSKTSKSRQASASARYQLDNPSLSPPPTAGYTSSVPPDTMLSQPVPPPGIPPISGMNPLMFMQNPTAMTMQNPTAMNMQNPTAINMQNSTAMSMQSIPSSVLAFTAQATQAMMANMFMGMNPNMIPNQQPISNDAFMLALQDSMRNRVVAGFPGLQPQSGTFPASQPVSPLPEPPVPYPSAPSSSNKRETFKSSTPVSVSGPSVSRRVSSISEFESTSRKGKDKERTSPAAKRRKVSSSSAMDIEMDDPCTPPLPDSSSRQEIFKTKSGRSLSFFVQIEIHNRFQLVSSIKKNGGIIVDSPILADYAILYAGNQRQKVFKALLRAAYTADVPAVQAKFVHDCLSKRRLLRATEYLYDLEFKRKRRSSAPRRSIESESADEDDEPEIDEEEQRRLAKNAREAERRMRIKKEKEQELKPKATPAPVSDKTPKLGRPPKSIERSYPKATNGPRTPSPPPENTRETCPQGYRFSRAEDDFALRFAKVMIDRDYTISQSAVTSAVHKKLPHHTLLSWRSHFNIIAGEWDAWRRRSLIAHRKAEVQRQQEASSSSGPSTSKEVIEVQNNPAASTPVSKGKVPSDLEDDIKTVVRFFADGNDCDQTEDESLVWQRLASKTPCKTESNWATFYEKHAHDVIDRYNATID